ncbi:MAG TPA: hypothetical protein PLF40_11250, partial [Kofleriaceae bacterium]|nr:hypothetical protein [Kofleriaceae bacterium]
VPAGGGAQNTQRDARTGAGPKPEPVKATSRTNTVANAAEANVAPKQYDLKALDSLNRRQRAIHEKLPAKGAMVVVPKKTVSMSDLRAIGRVTGDEYSMYTKKGERLIIRGDGPEIIVPDQAFADALRAGKHGRWSGHTHPPGYANRPGPADRPNIPDAQSRSGIWSDDGAAPFYRTPQDDLIFEEEQRRQQWRKLYDND